MIYYIKYFITSPFHVIIWTDAAEHWRQSQIRPSFVTRVSVGEGEKEEIVEIETKISR